MNCWTVLLLFVVSVYEVVECQQANDGDDQNCEPSLADACFDAVTENLQCLALQGKTRSCASAGDDLCSSIDDALQCTSDIIDTDCGKKDGRDRFDAWLRGLRAVYYFTCGRNQIGLLGMTQNPDCWNPIGFLKCTEKMAGINHVNDLLKQRLDMNECNRLLISISVCNARATNMQSTRCTPSLENVNEIIHTFFSKTECGRLCNTANSAVSKQSSLDALLASSLFIFLSMINQ